MKFLVDAQLPVRLARFIQTTGYDTVHTRDLPQQNATSDPQINQISIQQERKSWIYFSIMTILK
jgi:predicted nuclease of predicted toxin-antitoxin system